MMYGFRRIRVLRTDTVVTAIMSTEHRATGWYKSRVSVLNKNCELKILKPLQYIGEPHKTHHSTTVPLLDLRSKEDQYL